MELKQASKDYLLTQVGLLIVPYGIETTVNFGEQAGTVVHF